MHTQSISEQDTVPISISRRNMLSLRQLREHYHLSYFQVAQAAHVHPRVVYWMEHGVRVSLLDALAVLASFSIRTNWRHTYTFVNVQGVSGSNRLMLPRYTGGLVMANKSEVARLLEQIDQEYEAAQRGLEGMAITARHDFITVRMERIASHYRSLSQVVDPDEARALLLKPSEHEKQEED